MFTYGVWEEFVIKKVKNSWVYGDLEYVEVVAAIILSLLSIPIDLLLSPIEIIGFIIYKIITKIEED
jgi:hypothetical protein